MSVRPRPRPTSGRRVLVEAALFDLETGTRLIEPEAARQAEQDRRRRALEDLLEPDELAVIDDLMAGRLTGALGDILDERMGPSEAGEDEWRQAYEQVRAVTRA